jgi:hypothetical protein
MVLHRSFATYKEAEIEALLFAKNWINMNPIEKVKDL